MRGQKKKPQNEMKLELASRSVNEALARAAVSSMVAQLDPKLDELTELRTAVSEAVTNAIIHGYRGSEGTVYISCRYYSDRTVVIKVKDKGCGIEDIEQARVPLYTGDPSGERGGMGFAIMESFCDRVKVSSKPNAGTTVTLTKRFR